MTANPALQEIFSDYQDALDSCGRERWSEVPYGFAAFRDGTSIPKLARILFRDELEPFVGDPFVLLPPKLNAPARLHPNPSGVVTRLMHKLCVPI